MNVSKRFKIIDLSQIEKKSVKIETDAYYILTTLVDHDDLD